MRSLRRSRFFIAAALTGFPICVAYSATNASDWHDLAMAAGARDMKTVQRLLDKGVDPNAPCPTVGDLPIPIVHAIMAKDSNMIALLLAHHADVNKRDCYTSEAMTPLIAAARYGTPAITATLLKAGANVSLTDSNGATALDFALAEGDPDHKAISALLSAYGAKRGSGKVKLPAAATKHIPSPANQLAKKCLDDKDDDSRVVDCSAAIASGKLSAQELYDAYSVRAAAYFGKKQFDALFADASSLIGLNANDSSNYVWRGVAYDGMGKPNLAVAEYTTAIAKNPRDEFAHLERGINYGKAGNLQEARADFTACLAIHPKLKACSDSLATVNDLIGQRKP